MSPHKNFQKEHLSYYKTLSLNLKYYRYRLNMTQKQVALCAGISTQYMSILEKSTIKNVPSIETLFCLADALKIEPHLLFKSLDKWEG